MKYKAKYMLLKDNQQGGQHEDKRIKLKLRPYFILDDNEYTDNVETSNMELDDILNFRFSDDTLDLQGFLNNLFKVIEYDFDINKEVLYITLEKRDGTQFIEKDFVRIRNLFDPYNNEPDAWMQWNIVIFSEEEFKRSDIYKGNHKVELGLDVMKIDFV